MLNQGVEENAGEVVQPYDIHCYTLKIERVDQ